MNKLKQLNVLVLLAFLVMGCNDSSSQSSESSDQGSNSFVINCEITNAPTGKVFLEEINGQNFVTKQTLDVTTDGKFTFEGNIESPEFYRVRFYNGQFFFLIVSPSEISVKADGAKIFETLKVEGSEDSQIFNDFVLENSRRTTALQQMQANYQQRMMNGDQSAQVEFQQKYQEMAKENSDYLKGIIDANIGSVIAPYLALSLDFEGEYEYLSKVSSRIDESQNNKYQQQLSARIASSKSLSIGAPAPEIDLPNPEGQNLKLSDLKGKVVLIDFWASWCRPCRAENPNVVRMYKKFKDKDFEILGVSLDKNKDAWVKAIENDGITWPQVSDLQFWNCIAAKTYQVSSIPRTYLIDKEGNILAKNLRGAELEAKLLEVLGE